MANETNGLTHLIRSVPHHFRAKITTKSRNTEVDFLKIRQMSAAANLLSTGRENVTVSGVMLRIGVALKISLQRCEFKIFHELA